MTLTYASLCSGYGGLDLAVEAVFPGARQLWHAEFDSKPASVHEVHWPGLPNLGDITTAEFSGLARPDLICAGYPCQPFSLAGKRKGTSDARHLWPHVARAVRDLRPRFVFLENVPGHRSLGFSEVIADLAEGGYDAEWSLLRASAVGAPHRRERLFILAADASHVGHERIGEARHRGTGLAAGGRAAADADGPGPQGRRRDHLAPREVQASAHDRFDWAGTPYAPALERWERITGRPAPHPRPDGRLSPVFVEWMMGLPDGWVTGHGLSRTAELKMLGNGVVPQQAAYALRGLLCR